MFLLEEAMGGSGEARESEVGGVSLPIHTC